MNDEASLTASLSGFFLVTELTAYLKRSELPPERSRRFFVERAAWSREMRITLDEALELSPGAWMPAAIRKRNALYCAALIQDRGRMSRAQFSQKLERDTKRRKASGQPVEATPRTAQMSYHEKVCAIVGTGADLVTARQIREVWGQNGLTGASRK